MGLLSFNLLGCGNDSSSDAVQEEIAVESTDANSEESWEVSETQESVQEATQEVESAEADTTAGGKKAVIKDLDVASMNYDVLFHNANGDLVAGVYVPANANYYEPNSTPVSASIYTAETSNFAVYSSDTYFDI